MMKIKVKTHKMWKQETLEASKMKQYYHAYENVDTNEIIVHNVISWVSQPKLMRMVFNLIMKII